MDFPLIDFIDFLIPDMLILRFTDFIYHKIDLSVSSESMELAKRRSPLYGRDYSYVMNVGRDPVTVNAKLSSKFPINVAEHVE